MAILERYFTSANSSGIIIWETGTTDVGTSFWCVGNKSDGTAAYTLINLASLLASLPSPITINSATLRLVGYNLSSAWGSAALTAKVSRITSPWSTATKWNDRPSLDTGVVASQSIGAIPSSSNYDYRTGYTAPRWTLRYYDGPSSSGPWTLVQTQSISQSTYNYYYNAWGGTSEVYGQSSLWHRNVITAYAASYSTYAKYYNFDVTQQMRDLVASGHGLAVYFDLPGPNNSRKYFKTSGESNQAMQWLLTIDYATNPAPTAPSSPTVGSPITGASPSLSWGASTDPVFASNQIAYEVELSFNGGSSWGNLHTTAAGVTSYAPNLKTILGLQAAQYYLNDQFRFRVRAKTPLWPDAGGGHYYSGWAQTANRTIDYRIIPSAPGITPNKTNPYEGETLYLAMTRPSAYNTHKGNGDAMTLNYRAYLDGAQVAAQTETVSETGFDIVYVVGNLTTSPQDRTMALTARCVDAEGQTGALTGSSNITIRRFRAPAVNIGNIVRASTSAVVPVTVIDTGFGTQSPSTQIALIQYNIGAGWVTASLNGWSGANNSFPIAGLDAETRYDLSVRAVTVAPAGSGLSGKTGAAASAELLEFLPAFLGFKHSPTGLKGLAAKSLVVGNDYPALIASGIPGGAVIDTDLHVGGQIHVGGGGLDADTLQGNPADYFRKRDAIPISGDGTSAAFWRNLPSGAYFNNNNSITNMPQPYGIAVVERRDTTQDFGVLYYRNNQLYETDGQAGTVTCVWRRVWHNGNLTFSYSSGTLTITTS